jgi:oxygen-dependent protoporphyrinogen oxidase
MTVLVVGGGIAGLAAAYELGLAGVSTTLLEASTRLGGKVRTDEIDGFLVETGPDSFVSYRPAAAELARELGLGDELVRPQEPRTVHVRVDGRFRKLPDGMGLVLPTRLAPFVTTDLFSVPQKLRAGLDLVLPRGRETGDMAVGTFVARRLGRGLVDRLAGPLIGGVYGTPIDELSLDAVVPQLRDAERRHRSLLLASLADGRARRRAGRPPASPFISLRRGLGSLVDALVTELRAMSTVEILTGVTVGSIDVRAGGVAVRTRVGGSPARTLAGEAAIVASPAPVAAGLLEPLAPEASRQIRAIPHGTSAIVSLGYGAGRVPPGIASHGFLVAGGEPLALTACTLSSRKWAGRAPDGALLARAFMRPDLAAAASDDGLVAAAKRDLAALLGLRGEPDLVLVSRHRDAMPHYTVGHLDRIAAIDAALAGVPNLSLVGGAYRGVGLPDCIGQGRAAARRIASVLAGAEATARTLPDVAPSAGPPSSIRLLDARSGTTGRIVALPPASDDLAREGLHLGTDLVVHARAPLGGPIVVGLGRARIAIPRTVAASIHLGQAADAP